MAQVLSGTQRRKKIIQLMRESSTPLSGGALGKETGVSRQVVVQDIALLRTQGYPIMATARGYLLNDAKQMVRLFKVHHTNEQLGDELETIIDLGGSVLDVMVNHRVYGKMSAPLNIKNRRDIQLLLHDLATGKSTPLMSVTSGYHFHHVSAESNEILDEIEESLRKKQYIAELFPYEEESEE
ncbi:transcription repressor NadR [[Eubacterium] hominis]|uniref:transcription repressor NadR n=1 Tax=[Eubacterium] hominis TaxID=2764325 RepID=UPI003A4E5FE5